MKINNLWGMALVLLCAFQALGQRYSTSILYNVGIPVSNTTDYLKTTSFRGISVTPRIHFNDRFSLGVTAGWNVFYEKKAPNTYAFGDGNTTLHGTQFRYINAFPLHVTPQVHIGGNGKFKPYAGLGLGTTYFIQNTNMGLYAFREKEWLLGLYPEVGVVLFPFRNDWHFTVSGKYHHLFGAGELPSQGYVGINVGVTRYFWGRQY
jgi:outer membrane protein W